MSRFNPQEKQSSGPMLPIPAAGVVPARVARIVEIGEHDTKYGVKDQMYIWFTLPNRLIDAPDSEFHGKQHMIRTAPLKLSSNEGSNLMKDYISILKPDCQDLTELLDIPCFVTIIHNEVESGGEVRTFANIAQVSGVPEGVEVGPADTELFHFSFTDPDPVIWQEKLWDRIRTDIQSALNYKGSATEEMVLRLEAEA